MGWFTFLRVAQPGPGAAAYALATVRMRYETMIGPGVVAGTFNALQPPQVVHSLMVPMNGLGGLVPGQFVGQPLSDPDRSTTSFG